MGIVISVIGDYFRAKQTGGIQLVKSISARVKSVSNRGLRSNNRMLSRSRRAISKMRINHDGDVSGSDTEEEHIEGGEAPLPTILLVQKHRLSNILVHRVFEGEGFDVDVARDMSIALDKIKTKHYDTIMVDVSQFEMIFYMSETKELLANSSKNKTYLQIPFFLAIADELEESIARELQRVGFNAIVCKPFRYGRLRQREMRLRKKKFKEEYPMQGA